MNLETLNAHPRDVALSFDEAAHRYSVDGRPLKSVTTFIHQFFSKFDAKTAIEKMRNGKNWGPTNKYFTMSDFEIENMWRNDGKLAASLGTEMHANIENYFNTGDFGTAFAKTRECELFRNFLNDHPSLKPFRTEWRIYDEGRGIAGSIDAVFHDPENRDGVMLADWKRCKEIKLTNNWQRGIGPFANFDDCNFSHYCLQLNMYRKILERCYGKTVTSMFIVVLHPDQTNYIKIDVPPIDESIEECFHGDTL